MKLAFGKPIEEVSAQSWLSQLHNVHKFACIVEDGDIDQSFNNMKGLRLPDVLVWVDISRSCESDHHLMKQVLVPGVGANSGTLTHIVVGLSLEQREFVGTQADNPLVRDKYLIADFVQIHVSLAW